VSWRKSEFWKIFAVVIAFLLCALQKNHFAFPEFEKGGKKPEAGIGVIPG
jgi:hypothetical protein